MLTFLTALLLMGNAQAHEKLISTNSYEAEADSDDEKIKSFTAKVRVVREDSDGMEVFFESEKSKGAYVLPSSAEHYGKKLKDLEASKKPNGPAVTVSVDSEKRIKSVELRKGSGGQGGKIPSDPNQKWNFGKLPENL